MFLGNGTSAAERQNDAAGDPVDMFEQLADQKDWVVRSCKVYDRN